MNEIKKKKKSTKQKQNQYTSKGLIVFHNHQGQCHIKIIERTKIPRGSRRAAAPGGGPGAEPLGG